MPSYEEEVASKYGGPLQKKERQEFRLIMELGRASRRWRGRVWGYMPYILGAPAAAFAVAQLYQRVFGG